MHVHHNKKPTSRKEDRRPKDSSVQAQGSTHSKRQITINPAKASTVGVFGLAYGLSKRPACSTAYSGLTTAQYMEPFGYSGVARKRTPVCLQLRSSESEDDSSARLAGSAPSSQSWLLKNEDALQSLSYPKGTGFSAEIIGAPFGMRTMLKKAHLCEHGTPKRVTGRLHSSEEWLEVPTLSLSG